MNNTVQFLSFQSSMQVEVYRLIIAGLEERWGFNDESLNSDLKNIAETYGDKMIVAMENNVIVGVGALVDEAQNVRRVVRMSVSQSHRRRGLGKQILQRLEQIAENEGCHTVVLETTESWQDAVTFYQANGYTLNEHKEGDAHFSKRIGRLKDFL